MSNARSVLRALFAAGVAAVEPRAAVLGACSLQGDQLVLVDAAIALPRGRLVVVGAGKAAASMAMAVEQLLGERITAGVVVVAYGHGGPLARIRCIEAAHPVPDAAGEAAALAVEHVLADLGPDDLVIACISGGASALLPAPRTPLTLADKQATTRALLACGAPIDEINAVRKHLSRLKGGQLAQRANGAAVLALVLSDVVGDDLSAIASGPFVADPTTFAACRDIVAFRGLTGRLPRAVEQLLDDGVAGRASETPKPGDACFARVHHALVGSNRVAVDAVAAAARAAGIEPLIIAEPMVGEARQVAVTFASRALTLAAGSSRSRLLIGGGETTVTMSGPPGKGGRAQEFALAAGLALSGSTGVTVLAAGTDGSDGPTDAAGAIADGDTVVRAHRASLLVREHLLRHDAYGVFAALDDLVVTGPTGTNVTDLYLAYVEGA